MYTLPGAPEPVPQVPQPRDQCCEAKVMNFIISELGSADSETSSTLMQLVMSLFEVVNIASVSLGNSLELALAHI